MTKTKKTDLTDEAGATISPPKAEKPQKGEKASKKPPKGAKKGSKSPYINPDQGNLYLLKAKLRKKFNLLKDEPLDYDEREMLLDRVCTILGMQRPQLDNILIDL